VGEPFCAPAAPLPRARPPLVPPLPHAQALPWSVRRCAGGEVLIQGTRADVRLAVHPSTQMGRWVCVSLMDELCGAPGATTRFHAVPLAEADEAAPPAQAPAAPSSCCPCSPGLAPARGPCRPAAARGKAAARSIFARIGSSLLEGRVRNALPAM
jgi:hypothetical protein